ncbi:MAG: carbohydrate-binding domain-containing protein [Lachnospiraceae bacterium]|nr:carbohydrate-binding domain-containing protein [Lachnospiraceae bacterium]
MSTDKRFDQICAIIMAAALVITVLFMNGASLGLQAVADEDTESSEGNAYFTANDLDGNWDDSAATRITLKGDAASIRGNGAYFNDGSLVIKNAGWYVISGELTDGSIIVDAYKSSKVWIRLDGVTVNCSDDSALIVKKADKVFLTLAEGSENTFADASEYSVTALEDGRNAAIYSKEDLTINGSGSLTVTGNYKHGIKCNDDFAVTGGTISITCLKDGIHANDSLHLTGADITIDAGDDAVHCDTEIYYADGNLHVTSCYEGLEAPQIEIAGGDIVIYASDDGINANGGSDSAWGMMQGGKMTGGAMAGGTMPNEMPTESTLPDGMPADGTMPDDIPEDGTMPDGMASQDAASVLITGGNITIINENGNDADGIDSNGDIIIEGGTILVSLTDGGGNNALDYGSENGGQLLINGGTVLAAGSSSMLEEASEASTQCNVAYVLESSAQAGTVVQIRDSASNILLEKEIPCSFSAIVISSPDLMQGETYTAVIGETEEDLTFDTLTITSGSSSGGMGFGMGFGRTNGMNGFNKRDRGHQGHGSGDAPESMEDMTESGEEQEQTPEGDQQMQPPQGDTQQMQPPQGDMQQSQPPQGDMQQMQPPQGDMQQMQPPAEDAATSSPDTTEAKATDAGTAGNAPGNTETAQNAPVNRETMAEGDVSNTNDILTGETDMNGRVNGPGTGETGANDMLNGNPGMGSTIHGSPGIGEMRDWNDDNSDEETSDGKKLLADYSADTWILLGASSAVLILGLILARTYKRRGTIR